MLFQEVAIHASALEASSDETILVDTSNGQPYSYSPETRFYLSLAASDTPTTLDVDIVATIGGVDHVIGSFTQLGAVATGKEAIIVANCPRNVKAVFTVVGTSYTFSVHSSR